MASVYDASLMIQQMHYFLPLLQECCNNFHSQRINDSIMGFCGAMSNLYFLLNNILKRYGLPPQHHVHLLHHQFHDHLHKQKLAICLPSSLQKISPIMIQETITLVTFRDQVVRGWSPKTDCALHHEEGSKLSCRSVPLMELVYSIPENSVQAMNLPGLVWFGQGFLHQADLELVVYLRVTLKFYCLPHLSS